MATDVPGVIYIGDANSQGGSPGKTNLNNIYYLDLNNVLNTPRTDYQFSNDRESFHITPHSLSDGASMAVASGAHIWYDEAAMSGAKPHTIIAATATSVTIENASLTSGVHLNKRLSFVDYTGGAFGLFSGLTIAAQVTCTGNTDQVLFFSGGGYTATPDLQAVWAAEGRFTDYHPCAGYVHSTELTGGIARRGGSSVVQGNHGVGPDAAYVPDFFNKVWNQPPYFHAFKYPTLTHVSDDWADSPNDAERTSFLNKVTEVESAAAERGNTIKWEVVVIDLAMMSLSSGNAAYLTTHQARLIEMINWLRSASGLNNSDLKIILINHRADMWNVTGSSFGVLGAPFYRTINKNVAAQLSNVGLVDMQGQRVANTAKLDEDEREYYAQEAYLYMGEEIVRVYQRLALGTATDASGGFPVYMYFGDSITVGEITADWTTDSVHIELSGPTVGDLTRPSNQLIYNRATAVLEIYKPHTNSNPEGHAVATAASDLSFMAELGKHHPNGFGLIKRGSSGSGLGATPGIFSGVAGYETGGRWHQDYGEHWPEMVNSYAGAMQYINNTLGKQADLRGVFVSLGHNDQTAAGGAQTFVDKFGSFLTDVEETFGTETNPGRKTHIVWRRPQTEAANVTLSGMALIRTAIENRAAADPYFHFIDVDDAIRDHGDDLHESPEAAVDAGRKFVTALSGAWMAGL